MLGERLSVNLDRVVLLPDYPNSVYFNAFDASVQAGGYNSYHEMEKVRCPYRVLPKHGDRDGRPARSMSPSGSGRMGVGG